jgi:hypothetical protein
MVPQANASVAHRERRHAALRIVGLAVSENITHTSQGSNEGPAPVGVYLPAQAVNMDIHDIGVGLDSHAPDLIENHRSCNDAAGISA